MIMPQELDFLRRVAVAESPRETFQVLVQAGQLPSSLTSKMVGRVKDLLTILTVHGGWIEKIQVLKALDKKTPLNGLFEPVAKVLVERLRVERGEIPDPLVSVASPPAIKFTTSQATDDLMAAARNWKKEREERSEQWFEERREEASTEMLHELSVRQLIKLLGQNPKLFPLGEEFEVGAAESGSETYTLVEYIKGWELERRSNSTDKTAMTDLKREVVAVIESLAVGFSKEEKSQFWWAMKGLTHRKRRRRRAEAEGFDERIGLDEEILARFEEARAKLPQETKELWDSLPQDEATLRLVSFLRRIRKDPGSAKLHGFVEKATEGAIAGVLVFQSEWLDALEERAKSDRLARIYSERLDEAKQRVHNAALRLWEQVRSQVASDGAPPYNLLRKIVGLHGIYTALPERIRQAVYGGEKSGGELVEVAARQNKSAEESTTKVFLFPVMAAAFAATKPRVEVVDTTSKPRKSRPKRARVEKPKLASPTAEPKAKKYGADLGQPVQKPSASEIALGFNGNRNRGVVQPMSYKTRRHQPGQVKQSTASA